MPRTKRIITLAGIAATAPVTAKKRSIVVCGFGGGARRRGASWVGGALLVAAALIALIAAPAGRAKSAPHAAPDAVSGQLYAFGSNYYGQLGWPPKNFYRWYANPTPTQVALPEATGPVTQIAAGRAHSLAVTSTGQLYAFGNNDSGQLGSATNWGTDDANPTPTRVTLPPVTIFGFVLAPTVTQVAAGTAHSLALTSTGALYAFGGNRYGQLGNATNSGIGPFYGNPTPARVRLPEATGPVTQIAAGANHSLVLTSTGQLYAFGNNLWGQLGSTTNGVDDVNPTPTLVTLPGARGLLLPNLVTQIAAGTDHSLAMTLTGALYAFGNNRYGQLGNDTNDGTDAANPPLLVRLPGATGPVTQIAAGANHSLVLTSTGQLYAFGDNWYGELGSATNNFTHNANPTPTLVELSGATGPVTQIAAGADHSLAVTSTGQLYAFGGNGAGELGSAINLGGANPTPTRVALPAGLIAVAVAPGSSANHTLVVLTTSSSATPPYTTPQPPNPMAPNPQAPNPRASRTTPPILSALSASPNSLSLTGRLVGGRCVKPTSDNSTHPQCTRPIALELSYTLDTAATVSFTLTRQDPGRTDHGLCLKVSTRNATHAPCTRLTSLTGVLTHVSTAGSNTFIVDGRIGGTTLGAGRYVLTATPIANGTLGSRQSVTFKLVN
jgi:alpha-tubulin suppressor-like RCC1 family protein